MWAAIRARKDERLLGRVPPAAAAAWRKLVLHSEDLLTAGVFERLAYLPGEVPLRLLLGACQVHELERVPLPEPIVEALPWPRLDGTDDDTDLEYREPDWVWVTASSVFIIEAKWGRGTVPGHGQLESQQRLARHRWPRRARFHISIVQSGARSYPAGSQGLSLTWRDLHRALRGELASQPPAHHRRVLSDALGILDARGVGLAEMTSLPALEVSATLAPFAATPPPARPLFADLPAIAIPYAALR